MAKLSGMTRDEFNELGKRIGRWIKAHPKSTALLLIALAFVPGALFGGRDYVTQPPVTATFEMKKPSPAQLDAMRKRFIQQAAARTDMVEGLGAFFTLAQSSRDPIEIAQLLLQGQRAAEAMGALIPPAEISAETEVRELADAVTLAIAVRARAFGATLQYVDSGRPSDGAEARMQRARSEEKTRMARASLVALGVPAREPSDPAADSKAPRKPRDWVKNPPISGWAPSTPTR